MYLQLQDYPPYFDTNQTFLRNLRYIHRYENYVAQNELITWFSVISSKMFLSEFPQGKKVIPCPRKIIFNTCEKMNVSDNILIAGGNVGYQDYCGFTE